MHNNTSSYYKKSYTELKNRKANRGLMNIHKYGKILTN